MCTLLGAALESIEKRPVLWGRGHPRLNRHSGKTKRNDDTQIDQTILSIQSTCVHKLPFTLSRRACFSGHSRVLNKRTTQHHNSDKYRAGYINPFRKSFIPIVAERRSPCTLIFNYTPRRPTLSKHPTPLPPPAHLRLARRRNQHHSRMLSVTFTCI